MSTYQFRRQDARVSFVAESLRKLEATVYEALYDVSVEARRKRLNNKQITQQKKKLNTIYEAISELVDKVGDL